jgi:geranylgeranyl transferase type-1 subunit beta
VEGVALGATDEWKIWLWVQAESFHDCEALCPGQFSFRSFKSMGLVRSIVLSQNPEYTDYDTPHIIMTYTALVSLAILRDDFYKLERKGLISFLRSCQRTDGRCGKPVPDSHLVHS